MDFERFDDQLRRGADFLDVNLEEVQSRDLFHYFLELKRWSRKINLIARATGDEEIIENHFLDSLALLKLLDRQPDPLLDIGTGAGFPGLVCKTVRPAQTVGLVEPRLKRVSFLRHVIRQLDLVGVTVEACRLEDGVELEAESSYGWVVSRAVTNVAGFLQMCRRFKQYGTRIICMKGPRYLEEFGAEAAAAIGWRLQTTTVYQLPFSGAQRALLVFEKS